MVTLEILVGNRRSVAGATRKDAMNNAAGLVANQDELATKSPIKKIRSLRSILWCCELIILLLAGMPVFGQSSTSGGFFQGRITLDGDISDFFESDGLSPKEGVFVVEDLDGLDDAPLTGNLARDAVAHPSGFNQRRIMMAYNPAVDGGTIFIGIDLPGGTGPNSSSLFFHGLPGSANPNFCDDTVGSNGGAFGRGPIVPFDADGNGEADTIGRKQDGSDLYRCLGIKREDRVDVIRCTSSTKTFSDNPRAVSGEYLGSVENYVAAIIFGDNRIFSVALSQDTETPIGIAELSTFSYPDGAFGAMASTSTGGSGAVLGYDVEMAMTNINQGVPELCARLRPTLVVWSSCNRMGSGAGDDYNTLEGQYTMPGALELTQRFPTNPASSTGLLEIKGSVRNTSAAAVGNLIVVSDWPAANTPLLGPMALAVGETREFTQRLVVPPGFPNCSILRTLIARGDLCGGLRLFSTNRLECPGATPPPLNRLVMIRPGVVQCTFTNATVRSYTVLATSDLRSPLSEWVELGVAESIGRGIWQFTDTNALPHLRRFYRWRSP